MRKPRPEGEGWWCARVGRREWGGGKKQAEQVGERGREGKGRKKKRARWEEGIGLGLAAP